MLKEALAPGTLPPGLRVYAIGDVHGCADRLAALHAMIAADALARPVGASAGPPGGDRRAPPARPLPTRPLPAKHLSARPMADREAGRGADPGGLPRPAQVPPGAGPIRPARLPLPGHAASGPWPPPAPGHSLGHSLGHSPGRIILVHLGDYIDRGPDSARVLERLLGPPPVPGAEVVNLVGNHEVMMLDAADPRAHPGALAFWLENGGAETLASYGASPHDRDPFGPVPDGHLSLLRRCALRWAAGDYLFVHAGIRPGVPLERQDPFDLLWIREPFLSFEDDLPHVVVHGHTPAAAPVVRPHRIGIDTGACFGGDLTCVVLEDRRLGFLAA